jgi:transcription-repair coupling factor (superfamily II helicase)
VEQYRAQAEGREVEEPVEIRVDLPVDAHLPHDYIPGERLRLEAYKRIAGATTHEALAEVRQEFIDRYGRFPQPVENLLAVAAFRIDARAAGLTEVALQGNFIKFGPVRLRESQELRLHRLYPKTLVKAATDTMLVPKPMTARVGGQLLRDQELIAWARDLIDAVLKM